MHPAFHWTFMVFAISLDIVTVKCLGWPVKFWLGCRGPFYDPPQCWKELAQMRKAISIHVRAFFESFTVMEQKKIRRKWKGDQNEFRPISNLKRGSSACKWIKIGFPTSASKMHQSWRGRHVGSRCDLTLGCQPHREKMYWYSGLICIIFSNSYDFLEAPQRTP